MHCWTFCQWLSTSLIDPSDKIKRWSDPNMDGYVHTTHILIHKTEKMKLIGLRMQYWFFFVSLSMLVFILRRQTKRCSPFTIYFGIICVMFKWFSVGMRWKNACESRPSLFFYPSFISIYFFLQQTGIWQPSNESIKIFDDNNNTSLAPNTNKVSLCI